MWLLVIMLSSCISCTVSSRQFGILVFDLSELKHLNWLCWHCLTQCFNLLITRKWTKSYAQTVPRLSNCLAVCLSLLLNYTIHVFTQQIVNVKKILLQLCLHTSLGDLSLLSSYGLVCMLWCGLFHMTLPYTLSSFFVSLWLVTLRTNGRKNSNFVWRFSW